MHFRFVTALASLALVAPAQSLDLPGPTGFVSVPHDAALVPAGGITIEAWIVLSPGQFSDRPTIVRKNPAALGESYSLRVEFGRPQFIVQCTGGWHTLWPSISIPANTPTHVAASYDGATSRVYVNGGLAAFSTHNSGPLVDTGGDLRIGKGDDVSSGEAFLGRIDAVRIWDHTRAYWELAGGTDREMPVGRGLVASWNFDGDLVDTAGGRTAIASGSTGLAGEFTPFTTALSIPAAGGFAEVPHVAALVPADGLTIEAWVRLDPNVPGRPTIVRKNPASGSESYNLRIEFGRPQFLVNGVLGNHRLWPAVQVPVGVPTHLAATYDGATSNLYMDGTLVGSATHNSGPLRDTGGALRIGKGDDVSGGEQFVGAIDSVRIWRMALTGSDLAWFRSRSVHNVPGMVASWEFEGNLQDGTAGHQGVAMGAIGYTGQLADQVTGPVQAETFGAGTSLCSVPQMVVYGLPAAGNPSFGFGSTQGTPNAPHVTLLSLARFPAALPVLGMQVWVTPDFVTLIDINGPTGASRADLALPTSPGLFGIPFFAQGFWLDAQCGPQGMVAANALEFRIW